MTGVLVHEWIAQSGGSENVLQVMSEIFPEAPVLCLWNDSVGRFDEERLRESWMARTPLRRSKALSLPIMPVTWRFLRDKGYDWALISSHAFAHHARFRGAGPEFRRMVYVHTPARYVWTPSLDARGDRTTARLASRVLQPVDRRRAQQGASFAANSNYVRARVQRVWGVDARVIHPPVQVESIQSVADWSTRLDERELEILNGLPDGFILGASRFIPYKQLDEVIRVGEATQRPVVLAGHGPSRAELELRAHDATVPVHFVDAPSDELLYALYQQTAAYVFPALEDFGIMPVEAMAAGAPVVARAEGGASESTLAGVTGSLIYFESAAEIREGVDLAMQTSASERQIRATQFGLRNFEKKILEWVVSE